MGRGAIRKPRAVLAIWAVILLLLGGLGVGVEERLTRSDLMVPGTGSAAALELTREHFGESHTLIVLLEGPRAEVDEQGQAIAATLDGQPDMAVVGPWSQGASKELRPDGEKALVLVRVDRPFEDVSENAVPYVRREVARAVSDPVKSSVTGYADVANGVHTQSVEALKRAEFIAAPVLLIVLLLVFRSVVAALLPLAFGLVSIGVSRGVIDLVNRLHEVDVVALNMASMMGLALGVDYSLVLVSRFREELAEGHAPHVAARRATGTAGRTVIYAGAALIAAMASALFVAPGNLMVSSSVGVLSAVVVSVLAAASALPATLALLGRNVDRWRFGQREPGESRWGGLALRAISRPVVAAALVLGVLAVLSAPALALNLGPPDPRNLPESAVERQDFMHVSEALEMGWGAPYEIVVATENGRITDPEKLRALDAFQAKLADDPDIAAVMGPAPIARGARRLDRFQRGLENAKSQLTRAQRDQDRLVGGLTRVDEGVGELRGGLALAADGAARLESGAGDGEDGAQRLASGIRMADDGAAKLLAGLQEARSGADRLASGGARLSEGSRKLRAGLTRARRASSKALPRIRELRAGLADGSRGLERLREPAQQADAALADAMAALDRMLPTSKGDPAWQDAYRAVATAKGAVTGRHPITGHKVNPEYDGLDAELAAASDGLDRAVAGVGQLEQGTERLAAGLGRLEQGARRLASGIGRLESGAERLRAGLARLESGGGELSSGLDRLSAGAQELAAGAGRLESGAGELESGLSEGSTRSAALESGVGRMREGVVAGRARTDKLAKQFGGRQANPALFDSGYLPLAALDKAPADQRTGSTFAVNLDRGGDAARIVVIKDGNPSRAGDPVRDDLVREADRLADDVGGVARVGGPAATLQDFDAAATSRLPILIITLVLVTYLALLPTLRSVVLPLIAVALNVLTVAAAFGVLALLFGVPGAPLGGTGDLDGIMVLAIFGLVFGLSIDYEVFLLARMREGYALTGTTAGAVDYGLRKTAGVITGAALIMTGVFVAFALSPIASMQQLGIGLTTAVLLDATVVRLVLLPAIVKLCSGANWWLPGWLDRLLPELDVEGEAPGATPGSNGDGNGNGHRDGNGHGSVPDDIRQAILDARRERETERIA